VFVCTTVWWYICEKITFQLRKYWYAPLCGDIIVRKINSQLSKYFYVHLCVIYIWECKFSTSYVFVVETTQIPQTARVKVESELMSRMVTSWSRSGEFWERSIAWSQPADHDDRHGHHSTSVCAIFLINWIFNFVNIWREKVTQIHENSFEFVRYWSPKQTKGSDYVTNVNDVLPCPRVVHVLIGLVVVLWILVSTLVAVSQTAVSSRHVMVTWPRTLAKAGCGRKAQWPTSVSIHERRNHFEFSSLNFGSVCRGNEPNTRQDRECPKVANFNFNP